MKLIRWLLLGLLLATCMIGVASTPAQAQGPSGDWELVNPTGVIQIKPLELAARLTTLEGKTVGLKWNEKPNGNIVLDRIAELLTQQVKGVKILKFYELEPTTVPQSASQDDANRKAAIIAKYKPDIVIGSQCD